MTTYDIPKSMSDVKLDLLEILAINGPLTAPEVKDLYFAQNPDSKYPGAVVTKALANMLNGGYAEKEKGWRSPYSIAAKGVVTYEARDQIKRTKTPVPRSIAKKIKRKKPTQDDLPFLPPEPQPVSINISKTADNVADSITALIEENARYRDLMLKLLDTLNNELGLQSTQKETQHES